MKFIGQYIQSFIARFRNDVYLEDIDTGTIASGGNLGLDSNNKIVKATDGDITSVRITTDSGGDGAEYRALSGDVDLQILGRDGVGVTNSGAAITAVAVPGEIDHDSLLNFAADEHYTQANITTVGTIGTGVWQGTAIASAYLDSDTAHLSGTQTFSGAKTFSSTISGSIDGQAATVATIAGLAPNTATTQATQPAIESIGSDGDTLNILADELLMSNTTADAPIIKLVNTTDDDQASQLIFEKLRDDDAVAVGQNIGEIWFRGQDSAQNTQNYGFVLGEIDVSTSGQESGKVSLGIANHDGGNGRGLILTGGSENNEVDATLGLGANSVVTIPGTIGTGVWQGTAIAQAYIADDAVTFAKASGVTPNVFGSVIKLLPTDFMDNGDGGNTKFGVGYTDSAGSGYGMRVPNGATEMYAFVSIPEGMKATHVDIFDKTNLAIEVFEVQINATTMVSKGAGNCNTTLDITDVNATATNMLAIEVTTTATTDRVYGGTVTIAAQ